MSALDVFSAALTRGGRWPTVLRPAAVAQRLDAADSALRRDAASTTGPARSTGAHASPDRRPERGDGLCDRVMGFADAAPVRSVHWFLGPRGTLIAESAWGSGSSAVLVGWAPHEPDSAQGAADEAGGHAATVRAPLPGALLLGVFDTADTARRLAELVPESAHADIAVVGRWALPDVCPTMSVRSIVHPESGVLRRELVAQLTEAFLRVQESAAHAREDSGHTGAAQVASRQQGVQQGVQESVQTRTRDPRR
ncbi:hypothetical protein [Brevibacterium jeotgali]|uniref:hypothetical protein n=1 Tax=Brevibacterium jeotgali TaxID=1262550 RepID=UPI000C761644|nr:hypothetical protein [Brevibacterium jeotgali]